MLLQGLNYKLKSVFFIKFSGSYTMHVHHETDFITEWKLQMCTEATTYWLQVIVTYFTTELVKHNYIFPVKA